MFEIDITPFNESAAAFAFVVVESISGNKVVDGSDGSCGPIFEVVDGSDGICGPIFGSLVSLDACGAGLVLGSVGPI